MNPQHRIPDGLLVIAGGGVGTLLRALAAARWPDHAGHFPATVLTINLLGAFILGWLLRELVLTGPDEGWRRELRLGVGTGVMGGFTTYSSFAVQTVSLLRSGLWALALGYLLASLAGGFLCCLAGTMTADRHHRARRARSHREGTI
ncbi:CrcB protein [Propionibacterium cyclohexanicum]|uniref:Fluoride-specific ion channel FluC n=1 Tax=Propionibacterium cyclohexanicum TaxID=64702 RepID=A0A1H9RLX0_9ACTN|nr:CrcB family protein [Propionibacterium cyclohexanicum]SER73881.1 CrcB protein [Propionibacterium cyclohexanicum]